MGNPKAFLTIPRQEAGYRPIHDRISDYSEVEQTLNSRDRKLQASRCMDCGVPFCHWACPLGNKQPEFQDALYKGKWEEAYKILNETNDFPEFTGRICPALCEKSCVLKLSMDSPVTIRENEAAIAEAAFREGYIKPRNIERNGRKVAIIGAGPAGLAAANQLNGKGYTVTVFDKNEAPGGLLRYGIPNFKLHKPIIDRRIRVMEEEGIHFKMNNDVDVRQLPEGFDAYCICTGAPTARDLPCPRTRTERHPPGTGHAGATKPYPCRHDVPERTTGYCQREESTGHRRRGYRQRLHRDQQPARCRKRHPNRNHAPAARRTESCHSMAPIPHRTENYLFPRRRVQPPMVSRHP